MPRYASVDDFAALPTVYNGQTTVTTSGTAVILMSGSTVTKTITIKAHATNTGYIYVGTSSVTSSNGFILSKGDTLSLDVNHNATNIYVNSSVSLDGVSYLALG